ncbi:hypothetical protein E2C01_061840 [Portunus trituberculatus]|uniref:Uncharacterized protein n=1 Tax=Portunus trituberculatus TaxID=210409 RepID=A0A5B7H4Y4_PORTR|nr:hypothetical protein [Portunus trituberculatus]
MDEHLIWAIVWLADWWRQRSSPRRVHPLFTTFVFLTVPGCGLELSLRVKAAETQCDVEERHEDRKRHVRIR